MNTQELNLQELEERFEMTAALESDKTITIGDVSIGL